MDNQVREILFMMNREDFIHQFDVLSGFGTFKNVWRRHELYHKLDYLLKTEPEETSRALYFFADWLNRYPWHDRQYRHQYDNPIACVLISLQDAPPHDSHALHLQLIGMDVRKGKFHWAKMAIEQSASYVAEST